MCASTSKTLALLTLLLALAPGVARSQEALKEFKSDEGKFTILLPGTPKLTKQTVNGIDNHAYTLESGGVIYVVSFFDLPPKNVLTLETSVQAYANGRKATLLSDKKIALKDNTPAREGLVLLADKRVSRIRLFIIGQRYFQLIIDGAQEAATGKAANDVLDSFKLVR
jgi:hypothetical protein